MSETIETGVTGYIQAVHDMISARADLSNRIAQAEAEMQAAAQAHKAAQVSVEGAIADESPDALTEARAARVAAEMRASDGADLVAGLRMRMKTLDARIAAQGNDTAAMDAIAEVNAAITEHAKTIELRYKEAGRAIREVIVDAMALQSAGNNISIGFQRISAPFAQMEHLRLPRSLTESVGPFQSGTSSVYCLLGSEVSAGAPEGSIPEHITQGLDVLRALMNTTDELDRIKPPPPVRVPLTEVSDFIPRRVLSAEPENAE